MKRIRLYLRFTFPLALFLGTTALATTTLLTPAAAEWVVQYDGEDPDGSHYTLYKEKGVGDLEHFKVVTNHPNGGWSEVTYWLNSNPDDPTGGKGTEKPDVAGMLKKAKG